MNLEEFRETLETLKDSELIKTVQKYVCLSLSDASNPLANSHTLLDLVYVECIRRARNAYTTRPMKASAVDPQYARSCSQLSNLT